MNTTTLEKANEIGNECGKQYDEGYYHIVADSRPDCIVSATKMAEWKEKELIDKAMGFLEPRILSILSGDKVDTDKFIEEFKKTMTDD